MTIRAVGSKVIRLCLSRSKRILFRHRRDRTLFVSLKGFGGGLGAYGLSNSG